MRQMFYFIAILMLGYSIVPLKGQQRQASDLNECYKYRLHISDEKHKRIYFGFKSSYDTLRYRPLEFVELAENVAIERQKLADRYFVNQAEKSIDSEVRNKQGGICVNFKISNDLDFFKRDFPAESEFAKIDFRKKHAAFRLDSKTELRKEFIGVTTERDAFAAGLPSTTLYRAMGTDSLFAYTRPFEMGGYSPEGNIYHLHGEDIQYVKVATKVNFSLYLGVYGIDFDAPDWWLEQIYSLSTGWFDSMISDNSFRIPVVENVAIDSATFTKIRQRFKLAKARVMSKREEKLKLDEKYSQNFFAKVYERFENDLSPEKIDTTSLRGQRLHFLLDSFTTHIDIKYKDSTERRYIMLSTWEHSVP